MIVPLDTQHLRRQRFEALAEEVYEPLQRYLRRRASPEEAEEVFNDVLLTLWRRIDDVPANAGLPWSYGIARRTLANARRGSRRHLQLVGRLMERAPRTAHGPDDEPEYPDLTGAMAALSLDDRELIRLWAWEQLEPREIAVVLDTTPNAVSLRLTRAKKRLAAQLGRQNDPPAGHEPVGTTEETP